ncbi:divalent-cation tolerance protein CutA [Candidatus Peregrinibacteria bacterium]|nr:divalent-cation tolerance protein CutA [Candidatus Peregrinibacteria bacterium]
MNCAVSDHAVCLITAPSKEVAEKIAFALVEQKLAACCSIIPGVTSIYTWEGKTEKGEEAQIIVKTRSELFPQLMAAVKSLHSYQVPEIIMLPITAGLPAYLDWIDQSLKKG